MKLYRVKAFGTLDGLQQMVEPALPDPVARQVLVRVHASALNFRDLMDVKGNLQLVSPGMAPNHIPLCDGAGEVLAVGPDVTRVTVSDRVAPIFHRGWIGGPPPGDLNILGRSSALNEGMLTEFTLVDESELVRLPDHLSYEEGATLPCAGVTAWYALHGAAPLHSGEDVLVMGTGGVSIFALQFAKIAGARVVATTTSPHKMDFLRKLGADVVIDASAGPGWHKQVVAATGGRGVDVTVEVGGGATWQDSVLATRPCGRMSLVGALSGSNEGMSGLFMMRGLNLNPTRVGSRVHFEQMNRAMTVNAIHPIIDRAFAFDDAKAAYEYLDSGKHVGKVVIRHS